MTPGDSDNEENLVADAVSHRKAEGLIISHPRMAARSLSLLAQKGFPFITVGRTPGWESRAVDVDNAGGAREMGLYMLGAGYRRISMITGPESLLHMRERVRGFREALAAGGLNPVEVVHCEFHQDAVDKAMELIGSKGAPDALFVGSGGEFLLRVMRAMNTLKMDRHKLGLAVFDDYPYLEFTDPQITAVRQPTEHLGRQAVAMLDRLINGAGSFEGPLILKTSIIPRKSCRE
jgi:LacI family transcriptional regulator